VANGWTAWYLETAKTDDCTDPYYFRPRWNLEYNSNYIHTGGTSQYIGNNWDTWSAGIYQTVAATPGTTYRFTFQAIGRTANEPDPADSETYIQMNIRAGIDPGGGTAWNGANMVWGGAGSPHDQWQQFSVEATATGNQITVFISANLARAGVNQCLQFLDTWYDAAQLVVVQVVPTATNTRPPRPRRPTRRPTRPRRKSQIRPRPFPPTHPHQRPPLRPAAPFASTPLMMKTLTVFMTPTKIIWRVLPLPSAGMGKWLTRPFPPAGRTDLF
jgi:hypothetical protein